MKKNRNECLTLNKAVNLLERNGVRMMIMHDRDGDHFYIVPGGRVERTAAQKIIQRQDIVEFDDGLFPGNPQSWRMQR